MRTFFALIAVLFFVFVMASMASAATADQTYTVVRGDTLSGIAKTHQVPGGWPALYAENKDKVKDPNLIYPGDVLVVPGALLAPPMPVGTPKKSTPLLAPTLPHNMREAERTISELGARIARADEANAVLNRKLEELQRGQSELAAQTANLGLGSQLVEEENDRLLAENDRLKGEIAALRSKTTPSVSPKVTATPAAEEVYYLPMWARVALVALVVLVLLNVIGLVAWRSQRKKMKTKMAHMKLLLNEAESYNQVGGPDILLLAEQPLDEVLADRAKFREEREYPKEERGEVLHAVLRHYFGDLVGDRKPALRAVLRFFFPRGLGLYRQSGAEVMIPSSGGRFSFGGDGSVHVSFYARLGTDKEINFDKLKDLIETNPEIREGLGIPSVPTETEKVPAEEACLEKTSKKVSGVGEAPTAEEKKEATELYNRRMSAQRAELRGARIASSNVSEVHGGPVLT